MKLLKLSLIVFILSISIQLSGQRPGGRHYHEKSEIIEKEKISFFNEELNLTDEEAEKFWPVYNDYQNRREQIFDERKNMVKFLSENADNMSETEINEKAMLIIETFEKETELMKKYYEKLKEVLPVNKAVKVYQTEHNFKRYLMHQIRENKGFQGGNKHD